MLPTDYPDRYLPLIVALVRDPRWHLLFTDGTQTLFVFDEQTPTVPGQVSLGDPNTVRQIAQNLRQRYEKTALIRDRALQHLGRLLAELQLFPLAEETLAQIDTPSAAVLRARVAYLAGDRLRARQLAEQLIGQSPKIGDGDQVETLCLLALNALDFAEPQQAWQYLAQALTIDPFHALALRLLHESKQ